MRKTRHAAVAVNQAPRTLSSAIIRAFFTGKTTARRVHAHADGRVGLALCRAVYGTVCAHRPSRCWKKSLRGADAIILTNCPGLFGYSSLAGCIAGDRVTHVNYDAQGY